MQQEARTLPKAIIRTEVSLRIWAAICCLVLLAGTVMGGIAYFTLEHRARFSQQSTEIASHLDSSLSEISTTMNSLVGLHKASHVDNSVLLNFSESLLEQTPNIGSLGRYTEFPHAERERFELLMTESGLYNFRISGIDEQGHSRIRENQDYYYPVTLLEPLRPGNLRLIGADFSTVDGASEQLTELSATGNSGLMMTPAGWPSAGNLILLHPVYRGSQIPRDTDLRLQQRDGGYWISFGLTPSRLLPESGKSDSLALNLTLKTSAGTNELMSMAPQDDDAPLLNSLFHNHLFTTHWQIGSSMLVLTVRQEAGLSGSEFALCLSVIATLLTLTVISVAWLESTRRLTRQRIVNQQALLKEREKAALTLDSVKDAVLAIDNDLTVLHTNDVATALFAKGSRPLIGQRVDKLMTLAIDDDSHTPLDFNSVIEGMGQTGRQDFDVLPVGFGDEDTIFRLTFSHLGTKDGSGWGHTLVLRDISSERKLTSRLAFQANHDALTGCTNRHYFEQALEHLIDELPRTKRHHALCYIDLDQFKIVNDTCGHAAGDRLLIELTENLREIVRDNDIFSRLGGDEFGLILVDANADAAHDFATRLHDFFQNYVFRVDDNAFPVRASIGLVHINSESGDVSDVLAAADIACYAAKDSGRNNLHVYNPVDQTISDRSSEMNWLPRLQNAIDNDEFTLYVQPVMHLDAGRSTQQDRISHYEFLLRLKNDDGTVHTPWQFVQAAERYDLMPAIDRWVIRNAIAMVASARALAGNGCTYSINLSAQSTNDPELLVLIERCLKEHGVRPEEIWFELTETAAISRLNTARSLFEGLQSLGCKVALDDFGSGLSSFGYLKSLPVDVIKIDGQFVKDIASNKLDEAMVKAINDVARAMNVVTVAEFVTDQKSVDILRRIGIDYAQGFHIGKPAPIDELNGSGDRDGQASNAA